MSIFLMVSFAVNYILDKKKSLKKKNENQLIIVPEIVDPDIMKEQEQLQVKILDHSEIMSQMNDTHNSSYSLRPRRALKRPKRYSNDFVYN